MDKIERKNRESRVRRSVPSVLIFLGVSKKLAYTPRNKPKFHEGHKSFWTRYEDELEEIARKIKPAIRTRLKEAKIDAPGSHEEAIKIIELYRWLQNQFKRRGVKL